MMLGVIMAIVAGAAMSVQGVMNTRLSEKIGLLESNAFVQGTAFLLSFLVMLCCGKGSWKSMGSVPKMYLLGGALGLVITLTVMVAIQKLNATVAICVILISQLAVAALIDAFGLMGSERIAFTWQKLASLALMTGSILLFKWK